MNLSDELDVARMELKAAIRRLADAKADVEEKAEIVRRLLVKTGRAA